ncbi:unnamed protein product, partial [Didymodactylos carnosus]
MTDIVTEYVHLPSEFLNGCSNELNRLNEKLDLLNTDKIEVETKAKLDVWRSEMELPLTKNNIEAASNSWKNDMLQLIAKQYKKKLSEIYALISDLSTNLKDFKHNRYDRIQELRQLLKRFEANENKINELEIDYFKYNLDKLTTEICSLNYGITFKSVHVPNHRSKKTILGKSSFEFVKQFEYSTNPHNISRIERRPSLIDRAKQVFDR